MEGLPESQQRQGGIISRRPTVSLALLLIFIGATVVELGNQPFEGAVGTVATVIQLVSLSALGLVARNLVILPVIFIPAILAGLLDAEPIVPGDMERAGSEMVASMLFYLPVTLLSVFVGWVIHRVSSRNQIEISELSDESR